MLKRKLEQRMAASSNMLKDDKVANSKNDNSLVQTSELFPTPFWKSFIDKEEALNPKLKTLPQPKSIPYIYNPLEYAEEIHVAYIKKYIDGPRKVIFIGMNPGANGMGQTGVPFGNVGTVRDLMKLKGNVLKPETMHVKRPVTGLGCTIEEPSGVRIWGLFNRLAGSLQIFSQQCFLYNFCPLIFFDKDGKNITPNELKGEYKAQIRDMCLETLDDILSLVDPEIIVAVGDYVYQTMKKSKHYSFKKILKLPHPSPRSLNNHNWPEKAELFLRDNDLIKYIKNEA